MAHSTWTDADTLLVKEIWAEYQRQHDVPALRAKAAGIDRVSGHVEFGESAADIWWQRQALGLDSPLDFVRVGFDSYLRKGSRIFSALSKS